MNDVVYGKWAKHWHRDDVWYFKRGDKDDNNGVFIRKGSAGWEVDISKSTAFHWQPMPGPTTLKEAQAMAMMLWRMA